jgi:hypothetical protein
MRRSLIAVVMAAGLLAAGCGDKISNVTQGEDEGSYVNVGPLSYQVQISRYLNPYNEPDDEYMAGLPSGTPVDPKGFEWFAVFMRIKNFTGQTQTPVPISAYTVTDTQGHTYRPLPLDRARNPLAYTPVKLTPAAWLPNPNSVAGQLSIAGEVLLFRFPIATIQNRPLTLHISGRASVSLDL